MTATDFIIIAVLACVLGAAVFYLLRAKKRGQTCVGCPHAKECQKHCKHK